MRRSFVDTLRDVRAGKVMEELDEQMHALVSQVQRTIKAGTLTLDVEIKPLKGSAEAVVVKASVKCKAPTFDEAGTVLFPTPDGNLQRNMYRQTELPGLAAVAPAVEPSEGVA